MPEQTENKIPKPIGEVILGQVDPRTLSREEFDNNPDILIHVATNVELKLDPNWDYTKKGPQIGSTIGNGLYLTNDLDEVERYADDRDRVQKGKAAGRLRLLPYQARMYDMRMEGKTSLNADVPEDFFNSFRDYMIELKSTLPEETDRYYRQELSDMVRYLNRYKLITCKDGYVPIGLRELLAHGNDRPEYFAKDFTGFMISLGYDGLIYNEGGGGWGSNAPSYVFYQLKNVSTYDMWQQRKTNT